MWTHPLIQKFCMEKCVAMQGPTVIIFMYLKHTNVSEQQNRPVWPQKNKQTKLTGLAGPVRLSFIDTYFMLYKLNLFKIIGSCLASGAVGCIPPTLMQDY